MKFTLTGEPRSTNNIYRYSCRGNHPCMYMTAEGKALKEDYQWQLRGQYHATPLSNGLKMTVALFFGTRRTHDVDNYGKLLLDAFTGIVWEDDGQIEELTVRKGYDKENPRVEVTIEPV